MLLRADPVLIVQGIFATDEGSPESEGGVVAAFGGQGERAQSIGFAAIPPAEIVKEGDSMWISSRHHDVADSFVDGASGSSPRVEFGNADG